MSDSNEANDRLKKAIQLCPGTEISQAFLTGMVNRMHMSHAKYGRVAAAYPHKIDALATLQTTLEKYLATGRLEYLIDAANYAMIEFMHPRRARFDGDIVPMTGNSDVKSAGRNWIGELDPHEHPNDVSLHTK